MDPSATPKRKWTGNGPAAMHKGLEADESGFSGFPVGSGFAVCVCMDVSSSLLFPDKPEKKEEKREGTQHPSGFQGRPFFSGWLPIPRNTGMSYHGNRNGRQILASTPPMGRGSSRKGGAASAVTPCGKTCARVVFDRVVKQ